MSKPDLDVMRREVFQCFKCGNRTGSGEVIFLHRLGTVYRRGQDIFLVAERPGKAGERLGADISDEKYEREKDRTEFGDFLRDLGLDWSRVYHSNLVKCAGWQVNKKGQAVDRSPDLMEVENCLPFLMRQIEAVRPNLKLIIACGGAPVRLFTGGRKRPIVNAGEIDRWKDIPVIVSPNPSGFWRIKKEVVKGFLQTIRESIAKLVGPC